MAALSTCARLCVSLVLAGCSAAPATGRAPALSSDAGGRVARSPAVSSDVRAARPDRGLLASPVTASAEPAPEAIVEAPAAPAFVAWPSLAPSSQALASGLFNPLPGGQLAGYWADTGLDIAANLQPVYAIAAATVEYAEAGHTRWVGKHDSRYTVRLRLDRPIPWKDGHVITHAYYGHLSAIEATVHEGQTPPTHVEAGQRLGTSGSANGSPHLHLGLLLDNQVEQDSWDFILHEDAIRTVLGAGTTGKRLPR